MLISFFKDRISCIQGWPLALSQVCPGTSSSCLRLSAGITGMYSMHRMEPRISCTLGKQWLHPPDSAVVMETIPVPGEQDTRTTNRLSLIKELGERGTFSLKEGQGLSAREIQVQEKKVFFQCWPTDGPWTRDHTLFQTSLREV